MTPDQIDAGALLQNLQAGVVVHAPDTTILYANPKALQLLRLTQEQIVGKNAFDPEWRFLDTHCQTLPIEEYPVNRVLQNNEAFDAMTVGVVDSQHAQTTWLMVNAYPEHDQYGDIKQIVVSFMDITHEKKDIPFEEIVAFASDAVIVTEATPLTEDGPRIVYVNNAFTDITGYTPEEVIGKTPRLLQGPQTEADTKSRIHNSLLQGEPSREEILNYSKAGTPYWLDLNIVPLRNSFGDITYFAAVERDITEQKQLALALKDLAESDPLTQLKNRRGFSEIAQSLLFTALKDKQEITFALIDIDFFKAVNDTYGHDIGDEVLISLAKIMSDHFRNNDLIARFGGEEFAVLLPDTGLEQAELRLNQLREKVAEEVMTRSQDKEITITISVGLSHKMADHDNINSMIKRADQALYQAKHSGRNLVCIMERTDC